MINRVVAQKLIQEVPATLRNAARMERKVVQTETALDPIGTSFRASHGQVDFGRNIELKSLIRKLINNFNAKDTNKAENFIQRQPAGTIILAEKEPVIHASMFLG